MNGALAVLGHVVLIIITLIFLDILIVTHIVVGVLDVDVLMALLRESAETILLHAGASPASATTVVVPVATAVGSGRAVLVRFLLQANPIAVGLLVLQPPVLLDLFLQVSNLL